MTRTLAGIAMLAFLAACGDGNPFTDETTAGSEDTETGITREGLPPGTTSPAADTTIVRREARDDANATDGNGFVRSVSYDGTTDTFTVDGLAFDGANVYQRGAAVSSLNSGAFAVYEADQQFPDAVTGEPINQFTHRAIYGVSRNLDASGNPNTQFAIVRTGAYLPYGFGGFVYQRAGGVTLPASGQAVFRGSSAGLRDFNGRGGLEYSTANVEVAIDFEDFDVETGARGDGVQGTISDRRVFDIDGNDITSDVVARINAQNNASLTQIPVGLFTIGPGVLDDNGEIVGELTSNYTDNDGNVQAYEAGQYYAIVSGDDPDEIVGVFVVENSSEFEGATVRDTSGFIVYRDIAPGTP